MPKRAKQDITKWPFQTSKSVWWCGCTQENISAKRSVPSSQWMNAQHTQRNPRRDGAEPQLCLLSRRPPALNRERTSQEEEAMEVYRAHRVALRAVSVTGGCTEGCNQWQHILGSELSSLSWVDKLVASRSGEEMPAAVGIEKWWNVDNLWKQLLIIKMYKYRVQREGCPVVMSTHCSCREPTFGSQHSAWGSLQSPHSAPGDPVLFSGLGTCTRTCTHPHTHDLFSKSPTPQDTLSGCSAINEEVKDILTLALLRRTDNLLIRSMSLTTM